jgi:hypothetical protein
MCRLAKFLKLLVWISLLVWTATAYGNPRPQQDVAKTATAAPSADGVRHEPDPGSVVVDAIAMRIEDDIIAESQIEELAAFQKLAGGQPKDRDELIQELIDQWIIRNDAQNARYRSPSEEAVNQAYDRLVQHFPSPQAFRDKLAQVGLAENAVRRIVADELYLTSFIDFKFRPAAQVLPDQVEKYYRDTLVPELKTKSQPVPALPEVEEQIRELLTQQAIEARSEQWLKDTRSRLHIEMISPEAGP